MNSRRLLRWFRVLRILVPHSHTHPSFIMPPPILPSRATSSKPQPPPQLRVYMYNVLFHSLKNTRQDVFWRFYLDFLRKKRKQNNPATPSHPFIFVAKKSREKKFSERKNGKKMNKSQRKNRTRKERKKCIVHRFAEKSSSKEKNNKCVSFYEDLVKGGGGVSRNQEKGFSY